MGRPLYPSPSPTSARVNGLPRRNCPFPDPYIVERIAVGVDQQLPRFSRKVRIDQYWCFRSIPIVGSCGVNWKYHFLRPVFGSSAEHAIQVYELSPARTEPL